MRRRHLAVVRTSTAPCSTCLPVIRSFLAGTIRRAAPPGGSGFWKIASKGVFALKPRPSRYAGTCRRAWRLGHLPARCPQRSARRSAVSGCQWPPSGLETVSNTCPCIGSVAQVDEKSCVRTPQSLAQLRGGADRPPASWASDRLGTRQRAGEARSRHLRGWASPTAEPQTARNPDALENSRPTWTRRRSPRARGRGPIAVPAETKARRAALWDRALPPRRDSPLRRLLSRNAARRRC